MMLNAIDVIGSPKPPTLIAIISDGDLSLEEKERVVAQRLQLGGCNLYETDSVWGYNALHWAIKLSSTTLDHYQK